MADYVEAFRHSQADFRGMLSQQSHPSSAKFDPAGVDLKQGEACQTFGRYVDA